MMKRTHALLAVILILGFSILQFSCSGGNAEANKESARAKAAPPDSTNSDSTQTDSSKTNDENKQAKIEEELIPVEVTTVGQGSIASYLLLSSNLETEKMADVFSRVQGLVEKLYVEEGDFVKKGQVLMGLEAEEYALAEEKARINYEQQKSAFERISSMHNKDLLSDDEYEQAKFTLDAARIEWEQAKLNLDYTNITAPINGVVVDRLRKIG
ncbi:MAG: efflux RND transporter periplasmic adaptor subunit, partial [Candidatus Lokiarchaeota archaeon]|nr:efflux RND transporter periplasmic adaptor subunit [Candidatus Lokiarchaeota archaeon]